MSPTGRPEGELLPLGGTARSAKGAPGSAPGRPKRELLPLGGKARGARDDRDPAREAPIAVTVVWATPDVQDFVALSLPAGATVADAVARSGLVERHGIDRDATRCGVHGRLVGNEAMLRDGDRVEICRALQVDAKAARRLRAEVRGRARSVRPPPR